MNLACKRKTRRSNLYLNNRNWVAAAGHDNTADSAASSFAAGTYPWLLLSCVRLKVQKGPCQTRPW